ncbi:hypothetical protein BASA81_013845 [Batrachochytrium salamandrivorans]|nr:hypothetical protein BASA81_013845 [Batrachochytrium salamandrivorans]
MDLAMVAQTAVLVQVSGPDPKQLKTGNHQFFIADNGTTTLSCSGWVLNKRQILTSAWVVAPFLRDQSGPHKEGELIFNTKISCVGENGVSLPAKLVRVKHNGNLGNEWFDPRVRGVSQFDVAVLECDHDWPSVLEVGGVALGKHKHRGMQVQVVSSAFGLVYPKVFRNSITKGVLCNILERNSREEMYFTDARCAAGSEGGPVFAQGKFLGMVLPALQDRALSQKLELAAILPMRFCVDDDDGNGEQQQEEEGEHVLVSASHSVALLRIGQNWGSGVLVQVDSIKQIGYLLTCAHVVQGATTVNVQFRRPYHLGGKEELCRRVGQVLFISDGPVDIAVVAVYNLPSWVQSVEISSQDVEFGDDCSAIGFSIFEPSGAVGNWATISSGNVCRVVECEDGLACMLQTCTPVFRGHSGGMLSCPQGKLLGIITSNAKHSTGAIIPEINFAIPASFLVQLIACIHDPQVWLEFNLVTKQSWMLKSIWALSPPPPSTTEDTSLRQESSNFYHFFNRFRQSRL